MKKELIILSGFLGSGKTTLLQSLLARNAGRKIAVLLNDFGDIPVDGTLLTRAGMKEKIVEIGGGSVFCSCLTETLVKTMFSLAELDVELVFMEASGMSDPSAVGKMLHLAKLDDYFTHTATICLFDAVKSLKLARVLEVIPRQLAAATVAVLTKADVYSPAELAAARAYIGEREPDLPVLESCHGEWRAFPAADRNTVSANKGAASGAVPAEKTGAAGQFLPFTVDGGLSGIPLPGRKNRAFSFGVNTVQTRPDTIQISEIAVPAAALIGLLDTESVLRVKGFLRAADGTWFVSDGPEGIKLQSCTDAPVPLTIICLRGRGADLRARIEAEMTTDAGTRPARQLHPVCALGLRRK